MSIGLLIVVPRTMVKGGYSGFHFGLSFNSLYYIIPTPLCPWARRSNYLASCTGKPSWFPSRTKNLYRCYLDLSLQNPSCYG